MGNTCTKAECLPCAGATGIDYEVAISPHNHSVESEDQFIDEKEFIEQARSGDIMLFRSNN